MKGRKKKKKPSNMVTKVPKVDKVLSPDTADQNFFKKPQMDKASRIAPDKSDENFKKKIYEVVVDGTNMDDKNDLQEMQNMIDDTFQPMFKTEWEKVIEKQKLELPQDNVVDCEVFDDNLRHSYIKCQEELTKCFTYKRMLTEVMKEITMTQEILILLMDKSVSLMKDKHANSEKEVKVVNAAIEDEKAILRCLKILINTNTNI